MEKKTNSWVIVAAVLAVLAAFSAVVVLILRARSKKVAWYDQEAINYDDEDCCECFEFDEEDVELTEVTDIMAE